MTDEDDYDYDDGDDFYGAARSARYTPPRTVAVHHGHKIVRVGDRYRIFWPEWQPYGLSRRSFGTVTDARKWLDEERYASNGMPDEDDDYAPSPDRFFNPERIPIALALTGAVGGALIYLYFKAKGKEVQ